METESGIYEELILKIQGAEHHSEIPNTALILPALVKRRLDRGQDIEQINTFINVVAEAVFLKCLTLSLKEMETPPPARFVFLVLGSACRKEQTIKTDQDNAIMFEDVPSHREQEVNDYFLRVGHMVCDWLHEAGYDYCEGEIMARNPIWCRPLKAFKGYFSKWIDQVEPKAQLRFGTFFDFRGINGDMMLEAELKQHIASEFGNSKGFFRFMAEIAGNYKAPLTMLGNLVFEKNGDHTGMFDFKWAMESFIFNARLLSYKYGVKAMNTIERLNELSHKKVIGDYDCERIVGAYRHLMHMRLANQLETAFSTSGEGPSNFRKASAFTPEDQSALKRSLRALKRLQRYLSAVKADDSWSQGPQEVKFES